MPGPVIVVRVPGTPFTLRDLCHDHSLLITASDAVEAGRLVSVQDLGTLQTFDLLYAERGRELASAWASSVSGAILRQVASGVGDDSEVTIPQGLRRSHAAIYEILGERLVSRTEPDCVVFHVPAHKDLAPSMLAATRVRAVRPRARVFACGRIFEAESLLSKALKVFDAISLEDFFPAGQVLDSPDATGWKNIPSLAYYNGARLTLTRSSRQASFISATLADPEKILYTFAAEYDKINVFDVFAVASTQGCTEVDFAREDRASESGSAVSALRSITEQFGSRAFHFRGVEHTRNASLERRLLASGLSATFSCSLDPARTSKARMGLMSSAGCVAVDVDLGSGSQRLLDTFYRRDFTVTEAERLMRASRFAGIFTAAHITYPCVEDDYHTEDETVRLIRRANPSSVVVSANAPAPAAAKGLLAQEFGPFRRHLRARALKRAAALKEKIRELSIPLDIDAHTALLSGLAGFRGREVEFTELAGLQMLSGDATGLAETIERINTAAARPARLNAFRPYTAEGNAVAN